MNKTIEKSTMAKKTLIYLAGNFSSKIFGMIIIPIYAKYLTASDLGSFDFQQTIGNLLMPVIALALWESILRFGLNSSEEEKNEVITTSVLIASSTIVISGIILLGTYIQIYGKSLNTILYVLLIVTMPVVTILGYISRAVQKNKIYAISGIVSSFFNMLLMIIFVVINDYGVTGLLLSAIGANLFNVLYLMIGVRISKRVRWQYFSTKKARELILYSLPLIFNLTFGWFLNSFSRFFINLTLGNSANGIYAFASKFSGIFLQVSSILNMSVIEDAVESIGYQSWKVRFERNIEKTSKVFFEFAILLIIVTSIYYNFVNNIEFKKSIYLVPLLLGSGILTSYSTLIGNIFPVFKETKKIFTTTLISGGSNVILTLILSKTFGLMGIAIAQVFSSFVLVFLRYIFAQKICLFYVDSKKFFLRGLFYLFISIVVINFNTVGQFLILVSYCLYLMKEYFSVLSLLVKRITTVFKNRL